MESRSVFFFLWLKWMVGWIQAETRWLVPGFQEHQDWESGFFRRPFGIQVVGFFYLLSSIFSERFQIFDSDFSICVGWRLPLQVEGVLGCLNPSKPSNRKSYVLSCQQHSIQVYRLTFVSWKLLHPYFHQNYTNPCASGFSKAAQWWSLTSRRWE